MDLLIKNGIIVNADQEIAADIHIRNGLIHKIKKDIRLDKGDSAEVIDAYRTFVMPGGIDPHVHMHLPGITGHSSDDFVSGSRAALLGGTTTIIDFVTPERGESIRDALLARMDEAFDCNTDYSFHISPVEWNDFTARHIEDCINKGFTSFKIYMAYKNSIGLEDDAIEKVMEVVAGMGGLVCMHCETEGEIEQLRRDFADSGKLSPISHALSRPPHTESAAVKRAIELAEKTSCPLYIVHVSTAESVNLIKKAHKRGLKIMAEVCPHHLLLDISLYDSVFEKAASYVLSPPLRSAEHREALWRGIQDGAIESVATDHCPFFMSQKMNGIADFRKIPMGAGGVEHRLQLLYTFGVLKGLLGIRDFVGVCSANPASIFGLYPRKGVIREGSDADVIIWDPSAENRITARKHHQNSDINIYEGMKTRGQARTVILGGQVVARDGKLTGTSRGQLLRR